MEFECKASAPLYRNYARTTPGPIPKLPHHPNVRPFDLRQQIETSMTRIQKFTPKRRVVVECLHAGVKKGRNECAERLSTQKREFSLLEPRDL
ncbi:hypothetical protein AVEN_213353-1 [Araneus ventricosus]|uniref:Uncharacterized protein n=1 Tax=Araneus ventricosus TaxID=182803 RepID=A0A4Y2JAP8_ARAVE|nr:hypothetical protein AVEN_213353-1 [Araneus ventricosus]